MPYSIGLDVDAATEATLVRLASRLEAAGAERTVRRLGGVHHLSLGVFDDFPAATMGDELSAIAATLHSFSTPLAAIGVFATGVVYLAPVVTAGLLELHRKFHHALAGHGQACWKHYRPGAWMPHISLALDVPKSAFGRLVDVTAQHWQPAEARFDALRLVSFHPVKTIWRSAVSSE